MNQFFGETNKRDGKTVTCMDFIESIDRAARQNGWTAQDAAEYAYENLLGPAKRWAARLQRSIIRDENATVTNWNLLRTELAKRFDEVATPAQKVNAISNISQAPGESAKDYYDKIRAAFDFLVREEYARQPPQNWDGYMACYENIFKVFYLKGLEPKTRMMVSSELPGDVDLDKLVEKVEQIDKALIDEKRQSGLPRQIAGMRARECQDKDPNPAETDLKKAIRENKELQAKISAMSASGGKQSGGAGRNRQRPERPEGSSIMSVPMKDRGWIFCFNCRTWGQHIGKECKYTKEQAENLPKEKSRERPSGKAFDRQFNTTQD